MTKVYLFKELYSKKFSIFLYVFYDNNNVISVYENNKFYSLYYTVNKSILFY